MEVKEMRVRPVHTLAAGATLAGLSAAGLISPTVSRLMDTAAALVGPGALAWALLLVIAFALMLGGALAAAREALIRNERLRHAGALAEARSVSLFSDEALAGVIALGDMGRRVEIERQCTRTRAGLLGLAAFGVLILGASGLALGLRQSTPLPGLLAGAAASLLAATLLVVFARVIARTGRAIAPSQAQVHAALVRHQERQEAERRLIRPNFAALTAVAGERTPAA